MRNQHTNAIDIRQFLRYFGISDTSSVLLLEIQKQMATNNVKIEDATLVLGDTITYEEFNKVLQSGKVDLKGFSNDEVRTLYDQIAERRDTLDKQALIRAIKNEPDQRD
jgi:hypothetical protein